MGCGGSKLKGDVPEGLGGDSAPPSQPARVVDTKASNPFTRVDYNAGTDQSKRASQLEYGPTEDPPSQPAAEMMKELKNDGDKLKPYTTLDEADRVGALAPSQETPDIIR